jgi:autophagy-related protein 5
MHTRPPSADPQGTPDRDSAYSVRSVPIRLYLPEGPVLQDLAPPILEDGGYILSLSAAVRSAVLQAPDAALRGLTAPADHHMPPPGTPNTLADLLSLHLPLLFPAPGPGAGPTLAYALLQGVITPPEAELAWLGACMSGADGWVNICIGLGRER